ncbi:hypothetical protein AB0N33_17910 [Pseudarthrobacter oxydans]|uniref:hypothetical protein n=1 Tax=Pseudarthrobacter oxydans TaxID=1671 RepID=UPI0034359161
MSILGIITSVREFFIAAAFVVAVALVAVLGMTGGPRTADEARYHAEFTASEEMADGVLRALCGR